MPGCITSVNNKLICFFCCLWLPATLFASNNPANNEPHFTVAQISAFAKKVEKKLGQKGARVFILSRVGRPREQLPAGIQYTHTALAVYSKITTEASDTIPGYAIYNLYQKNQQTDRSEIVINFPVDFFADSYLLETGIIIPVPKLQQRLLQDIQAGMHQKLHNPRYSIIANPFNQQFQNCTEYVLDLLNAAIYKTADKVQLKANAKAYFQAQAVEVNPLKLMFGAMLAPEVALSDHPDTPETATFTRIARYLEKYQMVQEVFVIKAD